MFEEKVNNLQESNSKLLQSLEILKELIQKFKIESLKRELRIIEKYISESELSNQRIDVVILGQFKAGKSSLINNIIGEDILSVGVIPVTSIVTRLQYAEEKKALVRFLNNSSVEISLSELEEFITESKNSKNYKNVEVVDVFLPQLSRLKNIRIIDTPGIGSFFKNNSDTTFEWLPEIGLALLTISVERPLSEEDITLLKGIIRYAASVKIILTKTDLISVSQLDEVINYMKKSLSSENLFIASKNNSFQPVLDEKSLLEIIPYSIKKNEKEFRTQLLEKVFLPLEEDYSANFSKITNHKIQSLIHSCISYLKIGMESSRKTEKQRDNLKNDIIDEQLRYQVIKNNLDMISNSYKNSNRETVSSVVMTFSENIREKLESDFQKEFMTWEGNLYKIARKFELWLQNNLRELLLESAEESILQLDSYLKDIQKHFDLIALSFADRLNQNVKKVLGIKLNTLALQTEVERIKKPDISVSYSFDIHIDLLWFLFPMFLYRKIFLKFFFKKIPYEVEKNLSRLTSSIANHISKIIDSNKHLVAQYVHNELLTIENILTNQKNESTNFELAIEELRKLEIN